MNGQRYVPKGSGKGRGEGSWRRGGEGRVRTSFDVSADGKTFTYPTPDRITGGETLSNELSESLKFVGCYSHDSEGNFTNDRSFMSFLDTQYLPDEFFKKKRVDLDLTVAEGEGELYSVGPKQTFHNFLKWIINNAKTFKEFESCDKQSEASPEKNGGRFLLMKNCLSGILLVPYSFTYDLGIYATYIDGTIYLMRKTGSIPRNDHNTQISLWAQKFEQYLVGGNEKEGVVCNQDFRCVLTTNLGPHKLCYSSATDCANPDLYDDNMEDLSAFLSLNCIKEAVTEKDSLHLIRFKMIHWYLECLTTGVSKVLVGYRDENAKVKNLHLYLLEDILRSGKGHWDPTVCLKFASEFLSYVKKRTEAKPGVVFCFTKDKGMSVITSEVDEDYGPILPEWFFEDVRNEIEGDDSAFTKVKKLNNYDD